MHVTATAASTGKVPGACGKPVRSSFDIESGDAVFDKAALEAGGRIEIRIPRLSLRHLPDIKNR